MSNKLVTSFKKLPPTAQWGIGIAVGIMTYIAGKRIYLRVKAGNQASKLKGESDQWEKKGQQLSYPASMYKSYANTLENAMVGGGTEEKAIYDIFEKLENDLDYLALKRAFGLRDYSRTMWFGSISNQSMNEWFDRELDSDEIAEINKILESKNIFYRV